MSPRAPATADVERILAMVPWIIDHPGRTKAELAGRFGISIDQLERDLLLIMMIGVPPYTPGDYVDVDDADGTVTLRLADFLRRPLRLTPQEGLALLTAGRALQAVPGAEPQGPLGRALAKLEDALDGASVEVSLGTPAQLGLLRTAAKESERVEIEYWSAGRDATTTRVIEPLEVFFVTGRWYALAWCHRARDERLFRVDRVRRALRTGEHFPARAAVENPRAYVAAPSDERVTLRLTPEAAWVAESVPVESAESRDDGSVQIVVAFRETAWLERLLLRVGPDVTVVAPPERTRMAAEAARRVLARYREPDLPPGDRPGPQPAGTAS